MAFNTEKDSDLIPTAINEKYSAVDIRTRKIAACSVGLGVAIINEMIGGSIANYKSDQDLSELMAAAILGELKI